jgi:hypothetical protein
MDPKKYFIITFALFSNGEVGDLLSVNLKWIIFLTIVVPVLLPSNTVSSQCHEPVSALFLPKNRTFSHSRIIIRRQYLWGCPLQSLCRTPLTSLSFKSRVQYAVLQTLGIDEKVTQ